MYIFPTHHPPLYTNAQVKDFIDHILGPSSLYGLQKELTLDSLVLSLLPSMTHSYEQLEDSRLIDEGLDLKLFLVQELMLSLNHCAGFHIISPVST